MILLQNLLVGFIFSFIGSIPPGSINLSVIQYSLNGNFKAAVRFALASCLVEFVYASIAVSFQDYFLSAPSLESNFHLISAIVMTSLGIIYLVQSNKHPSNSKTNVNRNSGGFKEGTIISILNPLAVPFWIAVTAYLVGVKWIDFSHTPIWSYISGISLGTFFLLIILAYYARKASEFFKSDSQLIQRAPGSILILLGIYSLIRYFL